MKIFINIFFLVFFAVHSYAQQKDSLYFSYEMINYSIEDGLPSNETYSIEQDNEGYIWVSTDNGVSRFNGYEFENFSIEDGLIDNTIFTMFKDELGRIWMPGFNGKLCYTENGKFYHYKYNNLIENFLSENPCIVTQLYVENDKVFISFQEGYLIIDKEGNSIKNNKKFKKSGIYDVLEVNDSISLLNRMTSGKDTIRLLYKNQIKESIYISKYRIGYFTYPFSRNFKRKLYASIGNLFVYYDNDDIITLLLDDISHSVFLDENKIYLAMENGVRVYNEKLHKIQHFLVGNKISGIFKDKNNGFWFASTDNGLFYFSNKKLQKLHKGNKEVNKVFPFSYKQKERLCFYNYYDKESYSVVNKNIKIYKPKIQINYLEKRPFSFDLIAKEYNFFQDNKQSKVPKNGVLGFQLINDSIFLGFDRGSFFHYNYKNSSTSLLIEGISSLNLVYAFDEQNTIVCKKNKAYLYIGDKIKRELNLGGFAKSRIETIELLDKDTIIGTRGNGLIILTKDSIINFNTKNSELLNNSINNFFRDENKLWIATSEGLNSLLYDIDGNINVQNELNNFQGLLNDKIRQVIVKDSFAYLGTDNGLYRYNFLQKRVKHKFNSFFSFKAIGVNGKSIEKRELIDLKYDKNNITINYEGKSFAQNQEITYRYKMIGLNSDWEYTNERKISYYKLNPGKYTFEIEYQIPDLTWSSALRLKIGIKKPFWRTVWFYFLILLLFLLVMALFFINIKSRNKLILDIYKSNQLALSSQMNPHFVFNAMNSIQNFMLKNESDLAQKYLVKFSRLIRIVFENSKENFIPLNKEIETLLLYVDLEKKRFSTKFDFVMKNELETLNIFVPPLIIQPFVENAIWHGLMMKKEKGTVIVSVHQENNKIIINISDNGIGVRKSKALKLNKLDLKKISSGLATSFERIKLLEKQYKTNLNIEIDELNPDKIDKGTVISFELPKFIIKPKI